MASSELRIGQLAALTGVSLDTLRYYERRRLLPRARRTQGGFRLFSSEMVKRVAFIKQAQELGFSLDEIERLLTGNGECQSVRDLLRIKLAELDERTEAMKGFRATLARHLAACNGELERHGEEAECPILVEIVQVERAPRARKRKK